MGRLRDKAKYKDVFVACLASDNQQLVHTTLQALGGMKDESLLPHYKAVVERFEKDEHYLTPNLKHRLEELSSGIGRIFKSATARAASQIISRMGSKWRGSRTR